MLAKIEPTAKRAVKSAINFRYHKNYCSDAKRILKIIETQRGITNPVSIKQADEYAREILGRRHFSPWLYIYAAIAGEFKEGWIPDNYYGDIVLPAMKGKYGKVGDLNMLNKTIFDSETFPDIGYFVNGLFFDRNYNVIQADKMKSHLFADHEKIVFKTDHSARGSGIHVMAKYDFDVENIKTLGNGVFQSYINQHEAFSAFSPNAVATIRITTAVDNNGKITLRACYLRIGRSKDTHLKSDSNLRVAIDMKDGTFASEAYQPDWLTITEHPDSKTKFEGRAIPAFQKCIDTALSLHKKVPFVRCIGWDVAVDQDENVKVMEWNGLHNDIKFSEAIQGPCFADLGWEKLKP